MATKLDKSRSYDREDEMEVCLLERWHRGVVIWMIIWRVGYWEYDMEGWL